jgi:hypothetical protein
VAGRSNKVIEDDENEITPIDFMEAVYLNPNLPLNTRLRAAIEAAPYRHPKLAVTAHARFDFAAQLDREIEKCIARSRQPLPLSAPKTIEHDASPEHSPDEVKGPMSRYRRW